MNRLQKKCLMASAGFHGFLLLLLVFGSAFFVAKEKTISYPKLQFFPSKLVEGALAGGGGNPNIARTEDVQKGVPIPLPPALPPVAPTPQPPAPQPEPPKREVKSEPSKPEAATPKKATPKPAEPIKPKVVETKEPAKPRIDLSELKPVVRTETDKRKQKEEAEAKEAAREAARQTAAANAARKQAVQSIAKATESLQSGFSSGTKVDVGGPGGEAYANYMSFVQTAYDLAWIVQPDLTDDDSAALVKVTIHRSGRVVNSRITRASNNAMLNKSVQRALDKVEAEGLRPFPDFIKESERTFTIEFNLKAKRLLG